MRILLINSEYPPTGGGASNASAHLAQEMARQGHEVTVLTSRYGGQPAKERRHGVQIYRAAALRRFQERSGIIEQISFLFGGSLWALALTPKLQPDVVLAFFGVPCGAIGLLLKLIYDVPYVVSLRGGDVPGFRPYDFGIYHRLASPLLHLVWRQAAAVVANSEGLRDLAQSFDPKVPIRIIRNGVDASEFSASGRKWDPPRLLAVGRVVYQKGIDLLIEALAVLKSLPWEFFVAGDGNQREKLRAMAEQNGINDRVHFQGWLDRPGLVEEYRRANLFVLASRHEGMPNVVLEAMASGLPVIASKIAGTEELVVDGRTGLLVPPEDVDGLREAVRQLLTKTERRKEMGVAGCQRVSEHFTWKRVAERYLELMTDLVEKA